MTRTTERQVSESWADETFNPWVAESRHLGTSRSVAEDLAIAARRGEPAEVAAWEASAAGFQSIYGRRRRIFAGPWGSPMAPECPMDRAAAFWSLVKSSPSLDWMVLTDLANRREVLLPPDWGAGYRNVWAGCKITSADSATTGLSRLRALPAAIRFAIVVQVKHSVGDLDLTGIDWVVLLVPRDSDRFDFDEVMSVRLQAMMQGVPVWIDRPVPQGSRGDATSLSVHELPRACKH